MGAGECALLRSRACRFLLFVFMPFSFPFSCSFSFSFSFATLSQLFHSSFTALQLSLSCSRSPVRSLSLFLSFSLCLFHVGLREDVAEIGSSCAIDKAKDFPPCVL